MKIIFPVIMVIIIIYIRNKISEKINPEKYNYLKNMPIKKQLKAILIIFLVFFIPAATLFIFMIKSTP